MIDELKLLIEAIAGLPHLAIWVVVMLFAYKVVFIGSVYGIVRYAIGKLHECVVKPKQYMIEDITINATVARELRQVLQGLSSTPYVHAHHVAWLEGAIAEKKAREAK